MLFVKKWKVALGLVLSINSLVSCAPKSSGGSAYTETSAGRPIIARHSNQACSQDESIDMPSIKLFLDGEMSLIEMEKLLNEQVLNTIALGGNFEEVWTSAGRQETIISKSVPFTPCAVDQAYDEESFEDSALSILNTFNEFEETNASLLKRLKLPKIKLRVQPLIKQSGQYQINNAYFRYTTKEITFLPQGIRGNEVNPPFGGVPLWKVPMVPIHEYGHHIFSHIAFPALQAQENSLKDEMNRIHLCIDNRNEFETTTPHNHNFETRAISTYRMSVGALNEGFADLVAYYSGHRGNNLKNFGCMEKTRDVGSPYFLSGHKKVLDKDAMETFTSKDLEVGSACNVAPNFQSIHQVGAVFAHAADRFFNYKFIKRDQRLLILMNWAKRIGNLSLSSSVKKHHYNAITELIFATQDLGYGVNKQACRALFRSYPSAPFVCR